MNRLLLAAAAGAAALAAATPAVLGLVGNPSFSQKLPVHVPSQAQLVAFDDHGRAVTTKMPSRPATAVAPVPSSGRTTEPGDDNGGTRTTRTPEPGDDNGGTRTTRAPEPGDDNGGGRHGGQTTAGDDHGRGH